MTKLPVDYISWQNILPNEEWESFASAFGDPTPVSIRYNHKKVSLAGLNTILPLESTIPWSKYGYYLSERPSFGMDIHWHAGAYYVQEASSMVLDHVISSLSLEDHVEVLDFCAAPGGKTIGLISLLNESAVIVANEVNPNRRAILEENIIKWGAPNIIFTGASSKQWNLVPIQFDLVLVDAPCSGEGMFRKDQAAIKEWSPSLVNKCAQRQEELLSDISNKVKPGGYLIYSTCTSNDLENINQIEHLCANGFESIAMEFPLNWNILAREGKNCQGYQFLWHRTRGEGFFIGILRKVGGRPITQKNQSKSGFEKSSFHKMLGQYLNIPESRIVLEDNRNELLALTERELSMVALLSNFIPTNYSSKLGTSKRDDIVFSHNCALMTDWVNENVTLDLTFEEANQYLRKLTFQIDNDKQNGWVVAKYKNLNLGWIKNLKDRMNNYYPKLYRILKS